jgi:hypothetical protein
MQFDVEEVSSYLHVHTYTRTLRSTLNFSIRISRMLVFKINNYGFIPISSGSIMNTTVSFNTVLSDNNENSKCFIFVRGALKARMEILTHRFVPGCFLRVILPVCVCVCTRLFLSDYMALGLMYVEHIFYIEPDLLFHAQTAS